MPGRDILGNDALVAPAALDRAIVPLFVFYTGRDRRFVQEMRDQSIKRGSSAKELGDRRDAANCSKWPPWVGLPSFAGTAANGEVAPITVIRRVASNRPGSPHSEPCCV